MKAKPRIKCNNTAYCDIYYPVNVANKEDLLQLIMKQYAEHVYSTAYKLTKNHSDAEEISQDVFLVVLEKIHTLRSHEALSSWIHRVTVNLCNLRNREIRRNNMLLSRMGYVTDNPNSVQIITENDCVVDCILDTEARQVIKDAIGELPADYKHVIVLNDIGHLSLKKTSSMLNISLEALKSRLHRARKKLKAKLDRYFIEKVK